MKTQTIAGHTITLEEGTRYIASRPIDERGRYRFPVSIRPLTPDWQEIRPDVIYDLTLDKANELLDAFNNGVSSLDGRVW